MESTRIETKVKADAAAPHALHREKSAREIAIPGIYTRSLMAMLCSSEEDYEKLLEGTGLAHRELLDAEEILHWTMHKRIIRNALSHFGNNGLGLSYGRSMKAMAHGHPGIVLLSSYSLSDAIATVSSYAWLRTSLVEIMEYRDKEFITLELTPLIEMDDVGVFVMETTVSSIISQLEFILGRPLEEAIIGLSYPPPRHSIQYRENIAATTLFSCGWSYIRVPSRMGDHINLYHDRSVHDHSRSLCNSLSPPSQWKKAVSEILFQEQGRLCSMQQVAAALGTSRRSLSRRLSQEGTSFRRIMDEQMSVQAMICLGKEGASVDDTALTLGYQDTSIFRRAFKRWFGTTPASYLRTRATKL